MQPDREELAWKAVERLYRENDEGLRTLADLERWESWRALCEELYLALCRPQRPPGELMDRAHEALYPVDKLTQTPAQPTDS